LTITEKNPAPNPSCFERSTIVKAWSQKLISVLRILKYPLAFLALPLVVGISSFLVTTASPPAPQLEQAYPAPPKLDPNKPTVAVVLARDMTEVADALAPYAVFKTSSAFNVVMVSEQRRPVTLSGNLEVISHFSFAELDATLGHDPDLIVIPNIPNIAANEALRLWVQRHGQGRSLVMSVCAGAAMFAATGLIDGLPATTHWGDIAWIEPSYPKVKWLRGQRYVDNGQFISTAGILSGIDGSLHMIDRLRGKNLAMQVANTLHYPTQYLEHPSMAQFYFAPRDVILLLNGLFRWDRATLGVALIDGMDELALAAAYDTYAPSFTAQLVSLAPQGTIITTKHGLNLVARRTPEQWATGREIMLPGSRDDLQVPVWLKPYRVKYTLATSNQFPFNATLKHLAQTQDIPTAEFAAKRLEYRFLPGQWQGAGWWTSAVVYRPLWLGLLALGLVFGLERLRRRTLNVSQKQTASLKQPAA
jgi:AraC family transcriptional regulator, transcriptional activator FtrA